MSVQYRCIRALWPRCRHPHHAGLLPVTFLSPAHPIRYSSHFSSNALSDTAFYHARSKTLVVGDLIYNLPSTESMPTHKCSFWKLVSPGISVQTKLVNSTVRDRASVQANTKMVSPLDFDRIIALHGVSGVGQYCPRMLDADYVGRVLSKEVD